jgi:hypothetical protein
MTQKLDLAQFRDTSMKLARDRMNPASAGQRSLDVLATIRTRSPEWHEQGKTPEEVVEIAMNLPANELVKSDFRLPGN